METTVENYVRSAEVSREDDRLRSITIKNPTSDEDRRFLEEIDALIRTPFRVQDYHLYLVDSLG